MLAPNSADSWLNKKFMLPHTLGEHKSPHYNAEVAGHCRRVAALARRTAAKLPLSPPVRSALATAAIAHECWAPFLTPDDLAGILTRLRLPLVPAPSTESIAEASRILSALNRVTPRPGSDTSLAASVLDACNLFDEAAEFAVIERSTLADALRKFRSDADVALRPDVRTALEEVTAGARFVARFVTNDRQLPVMPRAAAQLLRTSEETASPAQLHLIAGSDPALCARLLHAANSARFGGREPVSRFMDAAARLGIPVARKVLLSACFAPLFASRPLQDLWQHSQKVAAAMSEAARRVSFDPDIAWTAGLLHDIGRLLFKTGSADLRVRLLQWLHDGFPLVYAETLTYGSDHAHAGADLLAAWGLPSVILDAVRHHHQPEQSDSVLASLLFLAEESCVAEGYSLDSDVVEGMSTGVRRVFAELKSGLTLDAFTRLEPATEWLAMAG
jgi:putative nucleotidyltransferase with HDIG domain